MKHVRHGGIVLVNIAVYAALCAFIEIGFRLTSDPNKDVGSKLQWQQLAPYRMYTTPYNPTKGFLTVHH
jgi:hypothetical protein